MHKTAAISIIIALIDLKCYFVKCFSNVGKTKESIGKEALHHCTDLVHQIVINSEFRKYSEPLTFLHILIGFSLMLK